MYLHTRNKQHLIVYCCIFCLVLKDHPAVLSDLDLVEEAEQFTHLLQLEDAVSGDEMLSKLIINALSLTMLT